MKMCYGKDTTWCKPSDFIRITLEINLQSKIKRPNATQSYRFERVELSRKVRETQGTSQCHATIKEPPFCACQLLIISNGVVLGTGQSVSQYSAVLQKRSITRMCSSYKVTAKAGSPAMGQQETPLFHPSPPAPRQRGYLQLMPHGYASETQGFCIRQQVWRLGRPATMLLLCSVDCRQALLLPETKHSLEFTLGINRSNCSLM